MDTYSKKQPTVITLFGGMGDLAQTKLLPALCTLFVQNLLPAEFSIIAFSRKSLSDQEYVAQLLEKKSIYSAEQIHMFVSHLSYVSSTFDDQAGYEHVKKSIDTFNISIGGSANRLFYLAVPAHSYSVIVGFLKETGLMHQDDHMPSWARVLIEKPFGRDTATAEDLERILADSFTKDQIYRIDHYLEKDSIENILSLRFSNSVLHDIWNRGTIESMELRLLESRDVSNRGAFFDDSGALRDVGQNHLLQILALLTMQAVDISDPASVHAGRREALKDIAQQKPTHVVRAQYRGYTQTPGVRPDSDTETYFKIQTHIDTPLWKDVSFSIESGKALHENVADVVVTFRATGACSCAHEAGIHEHKNVLTIRLTPTSLITLKLWTKKPGYEFLLEPRILELSDASRNQHAPEAYERLFFDAFSGDTTRFVSSEEVVAEWAFVTPILENFKNLPMYTYEVGSTGPVIH